MTNQKLFPRTNTTSKTSSCWRHFSWGIISFLILLSNCSKKEPEPDISDKVTGDYLLNEFQSGTVTYGLPYKKDTTEFNASISVSKISVDKIKLVIKTNSRIGSRLSRDSTDWSLTLKAFSNNDIEAATFLGDSRAIFSGNKIKCYFGVNDAGDLGYLIGIKKQ